MAEAKTGDTVSVHYTGTLEDGTQFDSSYDRDEPLQFTLDGSTVISGFEQAVLGMAPGETATAKIPFADGYGEHNEELVLTVSRLELPRNLDPQVGQRLHSHQPDGEPVAATIIAVNDESITLDGNHPLAGKDLVFEIELVEIF